MKMKKRSLYILVTIVVLVTALVIYFAARSQHQEEDTSLPAHLRAPLPNYPRAEFMNYQKVGALGRVHEHADIKIYVNAQAIDFSQLKYQIRDKYVHFEDGRRDIVHKHATGVTIGYLLSTLSFSFDNNCLVLDTSQKVCDADNKRLRVYVNRKQIENYKDYKFMDLDKILITYGNQSDAEIEQQLSTITDNTKVE